MAAQPVSHSFRRTIGAAPATLVHIGQTRCADVMVTTTIYDRSFIHTEENTSCSHFPELEETQRQWVQVTGLSDAAKIGEICQSFGIHPLVAEDILNTEALPKIEEFDDYIFASVKLPLEQAQPGDIQVHQVSILITRNTTITFLEDQLPVFAPLIRRLSISDSRLRSRGTDYFSWAVLDVISDTALTCVDHLEDKLERMELAITSEGALPEIKTVHGARREVAELHRIVRPFQDIAHHFVHSDSQLVTQKSGPYLRDLYDHSKQAVERTEFLREHASSLRELYYTTTSHRMNEVMKVLASLSAIFLPLTFLAGVYGMNFDTMPELHWKYGYPILLCLFLLLGATLALLFKRKGWL